MLNACYSRPQAEALAQTIDCTVGMNRAIGDEAAIVFAASFYRAIGFGRSVKEAFELGKAALLLEGIPEDETPELIDPRRRRRGGLDLDCSDDRVRRERRATAGPAAASPTRSTPAMSRLTLVRDARGPQPARTSRSSSRRFQTPRRTSAATAPSPSRPPNSSAGPKARRAAGSQPSRRPSRNFS